MAVRRTGIGSPASFFSFQDILMCCLGIMILMSAVLSLALAEMERARAGPAGAEKSVPTADAVAAGAARVKALEAELRDLHALENRDLDGEIAQLRARLATSHQALAEGVERLGSIIDVVRRQRATMVRDPAQDEALQLIERRDALQRQLQALENRRSITFLARAGGAPTRVIEVAGNRLVVCWAEGGRGSNVLRVRSIEEGARHLGELLAAAERARERCLLAVKPSGVDIFNATLSRVGAERFRNEGFELIPEDRAVSDQWPVWEGESDG